ncbi:MAG: cyclic-di-AMP phosphodiesterase PgpH [Acidobacteriota bacterium]|nr:cyclic-di-AMP phosphodiesterase PgpH [Acidobacteriota bacterium]
MKRHGRRPRFTTPLAELRDRAVRAVTRPLKSLRPSTRFLVGFFVLASLSTLFLAHTRSALTSAEVYQEGDVVRADVIAPADITAEDALRTEGHREAARRDAPPVWNYDPAQIESAVQNFRASWAAVRQQSEAHGIETHGGAAANGNAPNTNSQHELAWPGASADARGLARAVAAHNFDANALELLTHLMRDAGGGHVFDERDAGELRPEMRVVDARAGTSEVLSAERARFVSVAAAREELRGRVSELADWKQTERELLASAMLPLIAPNVTFNRVETEAAREAVSKAVPQALVVLKRNQAVARAGDTVTPQMLGQFAAIREYSHTERRPQLYIGLFIFACALYWGAWRFTEYRSTITTLPLSAPRGFTLVGLSVLAGLGLMRVGFALAESLASQSTHAPTNDVSLWTFAIPFAASALLITMLVDTQLALITAVLTAVFAGLLAPGGILTACFALVSSSSAIYGIGRYRERQSVTKAGLMVGAVNGVLALAVMLSSQKPLTLNAVLLGAACGLAGGLLTAIFTAGLLPVGESLFVILTDVRLLELSNADLPVLGQLALRAPGTNQHSHAVGRLAEDAARAVGANSLLTRIGALYHDIGKLASPEYFIENQHGDNPHDRLRPTQSARIITSHVTYGLKLAREIGLPKQIADFIPQHHGTRTLHFFLRKAQAHAAEGETVDEQEFRYPGPKPQFKEAAIMMLADSCEAAARSLSRPDPENIRTIVNKIFDAIVSDGQLDECDLSLRELTKVRETITTSLVAIHHARIDYPGFNPPSLDPADRPLPLPEFDSEERGHGYKRPIEVPISRGGEVEDEALTGKAKR